MKLTDTQAHTEKKKGRGVVRKFFVVCGFFFRVSLMFCKRAKIQISPVCVCAFGFAGGEDYFLEKLAC